ncbi:hypothetical protein [Lysinibacillus sphaericus]|uniref:hypothetical protein n=1 Tax=Lysinibacillus sphaericus TaxID=1421 RepID=UPI003D0926A1
MKNIKKVAQNFNNVLEDIVIITAIALFLYTTYIAFGVIVGNYLLAIILLVCGILIAKR